MINESSQVNAKTFLSEFESWGALLLVGIPQDRTSIQDPAVRHHSRFTEVDNVMANI